MASIQRVDVFIYFLDLPTTQSGITVDKEWLGTDAVVVNVASPTHEYQLLLMNEDFKEFNPKSSTSKHLILFQLFFQ